MEPADYQDFSYNKFIHVIMFILDVNEPKQDKVQLLEFHITCMVC